jgi:two-component system cell cycle response regulator DivK
VSENVTGRIRHAWRFSPGDRGLQGDFARLRSAAALQGSLKMSSLAQPHTDDSAPVTRGHGPLVLIIEDTTDLRDLFAAELATDGFLVIDAVDGEAGIDKARRFQPDAILLDLMLPGVNGFSVARLLRGDDRTRNVVIVAVTALTSNRLRSMAIEAGCDSCLSKPVLGVDVVRELTRLLVLKQSGADLNRLKR